jgi:hypothetical protein
MVQQLANHRVIAEALEGLRVGRVGAGLRLLRLALLEVVVDLELVEQDDAKLFRRAQVEALAAADRDDVGLERR